MEHSATFRFHGSLNDFLRPAQKATEILYSFGGLPAVKDAIEAIGIPHPEVGALTINHHPAAIMAPLGHHDQVDVFPFPAAGIPGAPRSFVLDVHLGKLARLLRLLGFDTAYENGYHDKEIADIAAAQDRIVLTRDVGLLKHKSIRWGYWLRSQFGEEQLKEVIVHFGLEGAFQPFHRCIACNGLIEAVDKDLIKEKIPADTDRYFHEFYHCTSCGRVYWKGSHYEKMEAFLKRFIV
ncbi:Mut7-C RNAse domain-containing protein [Paraflavisolibacter sp. H34]|uniref:Mut7-C RNAse domain-containing protein n=1 Tax=Huijunlia imazamoxiresistens TaxID=3127457 RepID=UPI00301B1F31